MSLMESSKYMKRFILIILCVLFSSVLQAQEKHMEFKGIPLDGPLPAFVQKMKKQGYKTIYTQNNAVVMEGVFIGKNVNVIILATSKSNIVWKVGVNFEESNSWYSLKSDYFKIKESYIKKYGKPLDTFEHFYDPYYEGDGYELQALKKEKCTYTTYFETPGGMIFVGMDSIGSIAILYEDGINVNIASKEKENTVMDEI